MRSALLASALLLGACTTQADRAAYLNTLVGQPETELVRQLGVPSRSVETGGHKFLAYEENRTSTIYGGAPFFGGFGGGGFYGAGFGYSGGFPAEIVRHQCATTFELANDRVLTWFLRGNDCA